MLKKLKILIPILLSALAVVGTTSAMLIGQTGAVTNTFSFGDVTTKIVEEVDKDTVIEGGKTITKLVTIENIDSDGTLKNEGVDDAVSCFVRARITVSPEEVLDAGESGITILGMDENWLDGGDGFYYYMKVLEPYESTEPLMTSVYIGENIAEGFDLSIYEESVNSQGVSQNDDGTYDLSLIKNAFQTVDK